MRELFQAALRKWPKKSTLGKGPALDSDWLVGAAAVIGLIS